MLPVIVTVVVSVELNASFYAAWMIAGLAFAVPGALTTVLFAVVAANPSELASKTRLTLAVSFAAGCLTSVALFIGARPLLNLFGAAYAQQADWCLRILGLGIFPIIVKTHYVAICRIHRRVMQAAKVMTLGSLLELCLAAIGAQIGGLTGISIGWIIATCIENSFLVFAVRKAVILADLPAPYYAPGKITIASD
jgi:O-antigen/teichoic acid export membrane protein